MSQILLKTRKTLKNGFFVEFYGKSGFDPSGHKTPLFISPQGIPAADDSEKTLAPLDHLACLALRSARMGTPQLVGAEWRAGGGFGEETIKFYEEPKNVPLLAFLPIFCPKTVHSFSFVRLSRFSGIPSFFSLKNESSRAADAAHGDSADAGPLQKPPRSPCFAAVAEAPTPPSGHFAHNTISLPFASFASPKLPKKAPSTASACPAHAGCSSVPVRVRPCSSVCQFPPKKKDGTDGTDRFFHFSGLFPKKPPKTIQKHPKTTHFPPKIPKTPIFVKIRVHSWFKTLPPDFWLLTPDFCLLRHSRQNLRKSAPSADENGCFLTPRPGFFVMTLIS